MGIQTRWIESVPEKELVDLRTGGYAGPWSLETFNPSYWAEDPRAVARRGFVAVSQNVSADQRSSRENRNRDRDCAGASKTRR